ncbi:MAG: hypothetical protein AAAB35_02125, partial [Phyllobacterium sp.]|uniref:hypothetical protein n=1 Tax=Phyllobacterium sp. TaxID=1871046 RepID=UPI0030F0AB7A
FACCNASLTCGLHHSNDLSSSRQDNFPSGTFKIKQEPSQSGDSRSQRLGEAGLAGHRPWTYSREPRVEEPPRLPRRGAMPGKPGELGNGPVAVVAGRAFSNPLNTLAPYPHYPVQP